MILAIADPTLLRRRGLMLGGAALAVYLLAALFSPRTALQSWYAATVFWTGISLGALALLLIHHLTGGRWGWYLRPLLLAAIATLPLVLLAHLPLLLAIDTLYPWAQPAAALPEVVRKKLAYLNTPFFVARSLSYFALWLAVAYAAGAWRNDDGRRRGGLAAVGLILYALTITFYGVDWVQSLDPEFYSSTISYRLATSQFVGVMSFAIATAALLDWPSADDQEPPLRDLGNLLLSALMLWAYIALMKYVIIWSGDVLHEIRWYLHRRQGVWFWLTSLLVIVHFCLPFFALLFRRIKQSGRLLGTLAGLVLAANALDACWLVLPSFPDRPPWAGLLDIAALLALGGLWVALFLWQLQRAREESHG
ncbi:MAG TPA: hypothetical protein VFY81_15400 [Gammaproteobacteria bacterium]|nr:hypothetical protein [Gammaproteobacteria bacterium]